MDDRGIVQYIEGSEHEGVVGGCSKGRGQNSEKSDQKFLGEMGWWDVGEIWQLKNG